MGGGGTAECIGGEFLMADYLTTDTELKSIADAIRTKGGTSDSLVYPDGFVTAIGNISGGGGETKEWVRPSTWPDLDSLDLSNEDAMYYTVDCRSAIAVHELDPDAECTIGFCADTTGGTWTLERGKVENGTFVVTETCVANRNSGANFDTVIPITEGDFVVYRMRAAGDAAEGKGLKLVETCSTNHEKPVIEIYGRLPWASGNVSSGLGYREFASRITEHVKVIFPSTSTITDLGSMFASCSSLQSVDMSSWDMTNWAVTDLSYMFSGCSSLQSVDMSSWDMTNWAVTDLSYMFSGCYSLQSIDMSSWDMTGWAVTDLSYMFSGCSSLQSVDMSSWDMTGWAVTDLSGMFSGCYSLQSIDMSGWDTTGWAVTDLSGMFYFCSGLQSVDMSGWDTTGWAVTNLNSMFRGCSGLQSVDMSSWDTTNWAVTNLASMFYGCYSLQSVDMSSWDTTGWAVTNFSAMFIGCYSLQSVDMSSWNTTNWAVKYLSGMFSNCYSLQSIDMSGWDTTNWAVATGLGAMFGNCSSLQVLKFGAKTVWPALATQINSTSVLRHNSIVALFNALPTVTKTVTLTLGSTNLARVSDDEIAIATGKGWTVA